MNMNDQTLTQPMTIKNLEQEYAVILAFIQKNWPIADPNQRTFARTMKLVEELGELSDELLTSMNLQRADKMANFAQENVENEFADVLGSLILLALELNIDIETVIKKKIAYTKNRFAMEKPEQVDL